MEIVVVFGLPGAGKTFIGKILEKNFGFYLYDGDQDMSNAYKTAIQNETVTDDLRQEFFTKLIASVKNLSTEKIVVTQTFIKEKFREQFLSAFPHAKFVLVTSPTQLRENRLFNRDRFELSLEKWRRMADIFEEPHIPHSMIQNNGEGEEEIKKQLSVILASETRPESL